jgi:hypothetical protein
MTDLTDPQRVQLEDADTLVSDLICEGLNERMRAEGTPISGDVYSPETRDLLRRAWTIAAQLQHREVVADHIIIGMVTGDESVGAPSPSKFADVGIDLATLRIRTLEALAGLPNPTALPDLPIPTQPVAGDVVRWIRGAIQIAQARDEDRREIAPEDFVQIVQNGRQPDHPLHRQLQDVISRFYPGTQVPGPTGLPITLPRAGDLVPGESGPSRQQSTAEIGNHELLDLVSSGFEGTNRAIGSAQQTASRARTEVRRLREKELTQLRAQVDGLRSQLIADVGRWTTEIKDTQLAGLANAVGSCQQQLSALNRRTAEIKDTQLSDLAKAVSNCNHQLSNLDRQAAAVMARLPRPPAIGWVALSIVMVLVLGSAAGIALRHPSLLAAVDKLARTNVIN